MAAMALGLGPMKTITGLRECTRKGFALDRNP